MFPLRDHRNMTNCMDTCGDFSNVIDLVHSLKALEENSRPKPTGAAYNRYDQESFRHTTENAFKIQTGMSFHGMKLTELRSLRPEKDVAPLPKIEVSRKRPCPSQSSGGQQPKKKRTSKTPIIIVPAMGTAMISASNAKDLLQDYKFVSTEEKKRLCPRRDAETLILRRKDGNASSPYRIVDNPATLTSEEWNRVVAVFVHGRAWQFKGWHWDANPTKIFSNVCAFHIKFDDAKLDSNVAKWSCDVLTLSKTKRHLDKAVFSSMWQKIEQFIQRNKPNLRA